MWKPVSIRARQSPELWLPALCDHTTAVAARSPCTEAYEANGDPESTAPRLTGGEHTLWLPDHYHKTWAS